MAKQKINPDTLTERDIMENNRLSDEVKDKYKARQEELKDEMREDIASTIDKVWNNGERRSELIGILEHFNRKQNQLGTGLENALCIYARLGTKASYIVPSIDTETNDWWKKKGTKAISIFQFEPTKNGVYQTAIRAFDISQLVDEVSKQNHFDIPKPSEATAQELLGSISLMRDAWGYQTIRDFNCKCSEFVPPQDGDKAKLVLSANLNEKQLVQEATYLFAHLVMSYQEGYVYNPETIFTARIASDYICRRYGYEPKIVDAPPDSISTKSQAKEFLTAAARTAEQSSAWLKEVLSKYREREQMLAAQQNEKGAER